MIEEHGNKHGPALDDEMKHETKGLVQGNKSTRAEEWRDQQAPGEDQPQVDYAPNIDLTGGTPDGMTKVDVTERSELASVLGKDIWPASRSELIDTARANEASDIVMRQLDELPEDRTYENINDVWTTLGGHVESHRF
ncbi:MAG: DUF2795 domain-containing protein [Actinomycetes bacterium]